MSEIKKGVARIEVPRRTVQENGKEAESVPVTEGSSTSRNLMSRLKPELRDPWIVPLAGLLLAFSSISLIVQLLIAFN